MQKIAVLAAVALIGSLAQGCASDQRAETNLHVGKIQGVYVEEYKGVFVDQAVVGSDSGKPHWVYVTFAQPLADGRVFATAMLNVDSGVEPGDLVELQMNPSSSEATAPISSYVTSLVAKKGSVQARDFGKPGQQARFEKLSQSFRGTAVIGSDHSLLSTLLTTTAKRDSELHVRQSDPGIRWTS